MSQLDKPNLIVPLAASYNQRATSGINMTSGTADQRKINSIYQLVTNAMSGKGTLYLCKRPPITTDSTIGATTDIPYQIISVASGGNDTNTWVFSTDTNGDVKVANTATSQVILAASNDRWPRYVDKTLLSNVENIIVQIGDGTGQRVFFATAIASWTEITDADFTALTLTGKMEFMDGFAFIANNTQRIYNSDVNSLANWTATSFISKQIEQDAQLGLARLGRVLLSFGRNSVEGFYNAGNTSGSPLGRIPQLSQKIGLYSYIVETGSSRDYYTVLDGRMYFVGVSQGSGAGSTKVSAPKLYSFDGSRFEPIVMPAFSATILAAKANFNYIGKITVGGESAVVLALSAVTTTTQKWLLFFPRLKEWFEWQTVVAQPVNAGGYFLGVGNATYAQKLGLLTEPPLNWMDGGSPSVSYTMTYTFKLPSSGNHRKFMPVCGVVGDTQSSGTLSVEFSDDDYGSFSTARTIDLTSQKKQLYRCGSYQDRAVRLTHSANTACRLEAFVATVSDR